MPLYYHKVDSEHGYIETYDRASELRKFPIVSVSIAALTTLRGATHAELATLAAEAKKRDKAIIGSRMCGTMTSCGRPSQRRVRSDRG